MLARSSALALANGCHHNAARDIIIPSPGFCCVFTARCRLAPARLASGGIASHSEFAECRPRGSWNPKPSLIVPWLNVSLFERGQTDGNHQADVCWAAQMPTLAGTKHVLATGRIQCSLSRQCIIETQACRWHVKRNVIKRFVFTLENRDMLVIRCGPPNFFEQPVVIVSFPSGLLSEVGHAILLF